MIIGLGTGRCGTVSLSNLLQKANLNVTHELRPVVHWETGSAKQRLQYLNSMNVDGDVALWYLNYVEELNNISNNIRFVCLQRNIDEVVSSFMTKTNGRNNNHWVKHDGIKWATNDTWDLCFPKYDVETKSQAIRLYCEEYRDRSLQYQNKMKNFKVFDTNTLNSHEGVQNIFNFLNIDTEVTEDMVNIRSNRN